MRLRGALLLVALPAFTARGQGPARSGTVIRPDTVTVGQPFRVDVRVRAAAGATIIFPPGPDSAGGVQALDPRVITDAHAAGAVDQTASYRLAAWNVGTLRVGLPDVIVEADGRQTLVPLAGLTVFVKSVLPADSSLRVARPARDLLVSPAVPWWIVGVLALIAFLLWVSWRRRRRGGPPAAPSIDPFARAEREFARVAALGLVEAGERGRYVALVVEVLRDYLVARYPRATLSLTSDELAAELRGAAAVPHDALHRLLLEADLVKFARRTLTTEQALEFGREARAVVAQEHVASTPPPRSEAA
ncbi:MAG: DUF4381 family protein [Gemmatimonadaceae bacterium]